MQDYRVDYVFDADSSFIQKVGFLLKNGGGETTDPEGHLYVQMNDNIYVYLNCDVHDYFAFENAVSPGHYYRQFTSGLGRGSNTVYYGYDLKPILDDLKSVYVEADTVPQQETLFEDVEPITESDDTYELSWPEMIELRSMALNAAAKSRGKTADVLYSARMFEEYLRNG